MTQETLSDDALSQLVFDAQVTLGKLESSSSEVLERIRKFGEFHEATAEKPTGVALLHQAAGSTEVGCQLISDRLVVGRLSRSEQNPAGCDLCFMDTEMSRTHFEIARVDGLFILRDLHSRNGTFVNGRPLGDGEAVLKGGDSILAGNTIFVFTGA